jgi:hypothetical protein
MRPNRAKVAIGGQDEIANLPIDRRKRQQRQHQPAEGPQAAVGVFDNLAAGLPPLPRLNLDGAGNTWGCHLSVCMSSHCHLQLDVSDDPPTRPVSSHTNHVFQSEFLNFLGSCWANL